MTRTTRLGLAICAALTSGLLGAGICSAEPGPMDPGYCGARQDPLDCVPYDGPTPPPLSRGEATYLTLVRPGYSADDATLLRIGRGTCNMLRGGTSSNYVVKDIASHLQTPQADAAHLLNAANAQICPDLTIGPDGVARRFSDRSDSYNIGYREGVEPKFLEYINEFGESPEHLCREMSDTRRDVKLGGNPNIDPADYVRGCLAGIRDARKSTAPPHR